MRISKLELKTKHFPSATEPHETNRRPSFCTLWAFNTTQSDSHPRTQNKPPVPRILKHSQPLKLQTPAPTILNWTTPNHRQTSQKVKPHKQAQERLITHHHQESATQALILHVQAPARLRPLSSLGSSPISSSKQEHNIPDRNLHRSRQNPFTNTAYM